MNSISDATIAREASMPEIISNGLRWQQVNGARHSINELPEWLRQISKPLSLIQNNHEIEVAVGGNVTSLSKQGNDYALGAFIAPQSIQHLGDVSFCQDYQIKYPYMAGSMANGIASVELVEALANADMLASFGAAGLQIPEIEKALIRLSSSLSGKTWCANLIYSPNEIGHEEKVVDLYLKHGLQLVETSAYMKLTSAVVRYRVSGIYKDSAGNIVVPNKIIAKASRVELAEKWLSPPPDKILQELVSKGDITAEQAELAKQIPMAQDLTVEADSGGHTDNRPAITLLPTMLALRDQIQSRFEYDVPLRIGAAGGISTPASALGAFAMGAAYIVTGTVNQACQESGSSALVREMLANAEQADVTMAPAVDMFEMGVKLQVLKRGTMFPMRGNKLYELYKTYASIEQIPEKEKTSLEKTIFKMTLEEVWQQTEQFFHERDPKQIEKAKADPRHKMALIFRWYLGLSSRWANAGVADRQVDYQVWCGPAMGAFNEWSKDTFLAKPEKREAVTVAMNILFGAAVLSRANQIQKQGVSLPQEFLGFKPMSLDAIQSYLNE